MGSTNYLIGLDRDTDANGRADGWADTYSTYLGSPTYSWVEFPAGSGLYAQRIQYTGVAGDNGSRIILLTRAPAGSWNGAQPAAVSFVVKGALVGCTSRMQVTNQLLADLPGGSIFITPTSTAVAVVGVRTAAVGTTSIALLLALEGIHTGDTIDVTIGSPQLEKSLFSSAYFDGRYPNCYYAADGTSVRVDAVDLLPVLTDIQAKTALIPAQPAAVGSAMTLTSPYDAAKNAVAAARIPAGYGPCLILGVSGSEASAADLAAAAAFQPDLCIVEYGTNEINHSTPVGTMTASLNAIVSAVRAVKPLCEFAFCTPWSFSGATRDPYVAAIEAVAAACGGIAVDISTLHDDAANLEPAGVSTYLGLTDALHPNQTGHMAIANAITAALGWGDDGYLGAVLIMGDSLAEGRYATTARTRYAALVQAAALPVAGAVLSAVATSAASAASADAKLTDVLLKTNTIGSLAVTVTSPVAASGTITVYSGDDYASADARAITVTIPDAGHVMGLTAVGAVVKLKATQATWTAASVASTTDGYTVTFEATAAQTAAITRAQRYELEATLANGHVVTLAKGSLVTRTNIPAVV